MSIDAKRAPHPTSYNVGQTRYVQDLRRAAAPGAILWDPDEALRLDPDAYATLRRNGYVRQAIEERLHAVGAREWTIAAGAEDDDAQLRARVVEDLLLQTDGLTQSIVRLVDADLQGSAYAEIVVESRTLAVADFAAAPWRVPARLRHVDKRRFRQLRSDGRYVWQFASAEDLSGTWGEWHDLDPDFAARLVVHRHDDVEESYGFGRGLFAALYGHAYALQILERLGLTGASRRAHGVLTIGIDGAARGVLTTDELATAYLDRWRETETEHFFAHDSRDVMGSVELSGTGHEWLLAQVEHHRQAVRILLLGSTLTSEGGSDGHSYAQAREHRRTKEGVVGTSASRLEDTLTRDLVRYVERVNSTRLADLGLLDASPPRFAFSDTPSYDATAEIGIVQGLAAVGLRLRAGEVYERFGYTAPGDGEATIGGPPAPGAERPIGLAVFDESKVKRDEGGKFSPEERRRGEKPEKPEKPREAKPEAEAPREAKPEAKIEAPREKRASPGSQLPEATLARLRELGAKKFPAAAIRAEDMRLADLDGPDVHRGALIKWRDEKGRPQCEYSQQFKDASDARKWARVAKFASERAPAALDGLQRAVDGTEPGTREHAAATIALLIASTGMRPGGSGDSEERGVYGASTLRPEHVSIAGDRASFKFVGKGGKVNEWSVEDPRLARAISHYRESGVEGTRLFPASVADAAAANKAVGGTKLKDWRTLAATNLARETLAGIEPPPPLAEGAKARAKQVAAVAMWAATAVSDRINNTPAMARRAYIHPEVWDEWRRRIGA